MIRPPTLRVLHGVELFACEPFGGVALSRMACARRWTLAQQPPGVQARDASALCHGCPVGALHADEAGKAVQGGRHRRMIGAHSMPEPSRDRACLPRDPRRIVAPPAVVPRRRRQEAPGGVGTGIGPSEALPAVLEAL